MIDAGKAFIVGKHKTLAEWARSNSQLLADCPPFGNAAIDQP
jgi:hypothetical protein